MNARGAQRWKEVLQIEANDDALFGMRLDEIEN